jgi:hypothetical protein
VVIVVDSEAAGPEKPLVRRGDHRSHGAAAEQLVSERR